jgi:hypothetical protein
MYMEEMGVPLSMVKLSMNSGLHSPPPTSSTLLPIVEEDDVHELPGSRCPWGLHLHLQVDIFFPNTFCIF